MLKPTHRFVLAFVCVVGFPLILSQSGSNKSKMPLSVRFFLAYLQLKLNVYPIRFVHKGSPNTMGGSIFFILFYMLVEIFRQLKLLLELPFIFKFSHYFNLIKSLTLVSIFLLLISEDKISFLFQFQLLFLFDFGFQGLYNFFNASFNFNTVFSSSSSFYFVKQAVTDLAFLTKVKLLSFNFQALRGFLTFICPPTQLSIESGIDFQVFLSLVPNSSYPIQSSACLAIFYLSPYSNGLGFKGQVEGKSSIKSLVSKLSETSLECLDFFLFGVNIVYQIQQNDNKYTQLLYLLVR